jgi:uncharacterized membrane protein
VFLIGWRLFSLEIGALAAILLAASPIQIFFSQQVRMYTLLPLLALLSTYWLWRAVSDSRLRFVVAYGLATVAALYLHNFGLYLLPAHGVILLWSGALRQRLGTWLTCAACIVVAYLPWIPMLLTQLENSTHYGWFTPIWQKLGLHGSFFGTLLTFAPGPPQPLYVFAEKMTPAWISVAVTLALAVLGLARLFRRLRGGIQLDANTGWLLSLTFVPLASALLGSCLVTPHYVVGRVDQIVLPGFVLLLAVGLGVIRPAPVRYFVFAGLLFFSAIGLRSYYGNHHARGERAIAQSIAQRAQPGDAVL